MRRTAMVVALLLVAMVAQSASASAQQAESCSFGGELPPGSTETLLCRVDNGAPVDAIFSVYVDQSSITVRDAENKPVTGADHDTYVGFFRYSLSTERFVTTKNPSGLGDVDVARVPYPAYKPVCVMKRLTEMNNIVTGCRIGRIRAAGVRFDNRWFEKSLTMLDEGDQTRFAGWTLSFSEVVTACVGTSCPGETRTPLDEL